MNSKSFGLYCISRLYLTSFVIFSRIKFIVKNDNGFEGLAD